MAEEDQFDKEVYKTLYEFQLKGFESVKALHAKHEDKAAKYLTYTSLIIAAVSIFSKQYLFDNSEKGILFYIIVFLIFIVFASLCCIARFLFHVIEVSNVGKLDNSEEMVKFFTQNDLVPIYYHLSNDLAIAIKMYESRNEIKVDYLKRAFKEIKFCGLMFVLTVILIIIDTLFI
ncbi:hypothetical protein ACNPQK_05670 [Acinetobacter guillouiae]|uniref:hypothetical protein n=1 Tax=Acinetobacter guillouiae TaxID=106649 RepID=UPI003AF54FB5